MSVANERIEEPAEAEHDAQLKRLGELLSEGAVEEARSLIREMADRWPDSPRVQHYARVLAPPVVRVRPGRSGRGRSRELGWLREHGHEYPDQWLALLGDQLIAADPSVGKVMDVMNEVPGGSEALLHFQPGVQPWIRHRPGGGT
jgi:hypothetical protein